MKSDLNKQEKEFVDDVRHCISEIKQYLADWKDVHHRKDQISLSKDYYKKLARKACFDSDNKKRSDIKKLVSSKIDLSSLSKEQRGDKIVQYWTENIKKIERKIYDFEPSLKQYETAIAKSDKAHTKINLVNFRKMCLTILNITNDVLEPLNNGSILFEKLNQLTQKQDDKKVEAFVSSDQKQKLLAKIVDIKSYFEANGGYVPFGRVTLNRYTAEQKPENVDKKIDELLKKLHIIPLIKTLQEKSEEEIRQYFQFDKQDKKRIINDGSISDVERIQCFKYKTIPLHVQYGMAAYLEKHQSIPKEATLKVLKSIGMPYNVGEQYQKHLADKDIAFDFHQFPLKVSFDYAWENLARYTQNENANKFPVEQSKQFLKDVFGVDENNVAFKIYAELFALKEKLVTLEYDTNQPKDMEGMIDEVRLMLEKSTALKQVSDYNTHISNINKWITEWFKLDDNKRVEYKKIKQKKLRNGERWFKDIDDIYSAYNQAKNKIGLIRGGQRSKIGEYHKLTEAFKQLSVRVGKSFAELRDKLNEAYQLNKITHYGTIIEDNNQDRYMLLKTINHDAQESLKDIYTNDPNGNIKVYELKSFTSKTLHKIIKNKGAYTDFHTNQKIDYSKIKESWSTYKDDRAFLNWLKERLKNSTMAKDQAWNEFRWNFDNCTTYEQIEKEINIKS